MEENDGNSSHLLPAASTRSHSVLKHFAFIVSIGNPVEVEAVIVSILQRRKLRLGNKTCPRFYG